MTQHCNSSDPISGIPASHGIGSLVLTDFRSTATVTTLFFFFIIISSSTVCQVELSLSSFTCGYNKNTLSKTTEGWMGLFFLSSRVQPIMRGKSRWLNFKAAGLYYSFSQEKRRMDFGGQLVFCFACRSRLQSREWHIYSRWVFSQQLTSHNNASQGVQMLVSNII